MDLDAVKLALDKAISSVYVRRHYFREHGQLPQTKPGSDHLESSIEQQIEAEISAIHKIEFVEFSTGGSEIQALIDAHRREYQRKWGVNGVYNHLL
jgi:tRNA U54 and U55 pseudouridine synthase Pus10